MIHRAFALALCCGAGAAWAVDIPTPGEPVHLDVTSTSIGGFHASNGNTTGCDDNYGEALERLNLNASWGSWVAGLRLDGSLYIAPPKSTDSSAIVNGPPCHQVELDSRYRNSIIPEKVWLGWNGRHIEITAGDSYVSFGRGLTLALRKTDQLGLDTSERGLRVKIDADRVSAILVAGVTNINNIDEATGRYADDPNDVVFGASVLGELVDGVKIGANVAETMFRAPPSSSNAMPGTQQYQERWVSAGPMLDAPRLTKWLGLYLEGVMQQRQLIDAPTQTGFGFYGTATARLGDSVTALLEGKAYGDLQVVQPKFDQLEFQPVQYTLPPTAERILQPLEHAQRNIYGARLRVDWAVIANITVYGNYGLFRDAEGYQDPDTFELKAGAVHDPYVGAEARLGRFRMQVEGGWRGVFLKGYGAPVRADGHVDFQAVFDLGSGSSLEAHWTDWERTKLLPFASDVWREGTAIIGYRKRPWFAVSGILDYTTEVGAPQVWYPGGSAEFDFTESSNIRVFAGASRGGLRCVSGVCRVFPPFQGVKATLTLRF